MGMVGGVMTVQVIGRLLVCFTVVMGVVMLGGVQRSSVRMPHDFQLVMREGCRNGREDQACDKGRCNQFAGVDKATEEQRKAEEKGAQQRDVSHGNCPAAVPRPANWR